MTVTFEISSLCDTWNPSNLIPCVCGMTQNQNNYRSLWTKMLPMWKHYFTKMFLAIFLLVYVLKTKPKVLWILKSGLSWLNDWLIEWLIDWLIVCCFSSRSRIFHSYRKSPFPVKGRSKFTLKAHTVPIKLCINQARRLKMFSICHPQAGWLLWNVPLILKFY